MTPDSALGQLAQRLTRVEQRVEDTLERMADKFSEISENFRMFGPVVQEHAAIRSDVEHLVNDFRELRSTLGEAIREFRNGLDELEARLEREERDRQATREAREARERDDRQSAKRDRWARWLGTAALVFTAAGTMYTMLGGPH